MDNKGAVNGRGILFILSAPSGAGKSTLAKWAAENIPGVQQSVSCTTRPKRPGEIDGVHYRFTNAARFKEMIAEDKFIEWAEVHGKYYGTTWDAVDEAQERRTDLLLVIDVQGAVKLRERKLDGVFIFVMPPSIEELRRRLLERGTETAETVQGRLDTAWAEISESSHYDYLVINDTLEDAQNELEYIIRAERCRMSRRRLEFDDFTMGQPL
ncbi:MAG: guanylate kinase [Nitrospinae bacterium]|nr:guanylate kinase [Nitrospinota bacterium]